MTNCSQASPCRLCFIAAAHRAEPRKAVDLLEVMVQKLLRRRITSIVGRRADDGVMQVVLMKLYKKLCTSPFEGCVQRWLHVVGGNAARDRRRRRKARSKHVISIDLELETRHAPIGLEWIGLDDALDLIIKKMKASDQVLAGVWLEKQRGCTVPSIVDLGKRLGLSPNTVRNRLAGMRDRLRVALERLWGDGPGLAPI